MDLPPELVEAIGLLRAALLRPRIGLVLFPMLCELVGLALARMVSASPEPMPGPELLTCKQAAADLKINEETVRVLCRKGLLPCVRIGRAVRIPRAALEQYKRDNVSV